MEYKFFLSGLDCPNCAAKIEKSLNDLEQIEKATINLIEQTVAIYSESDKSEIFLLVEKTVHTFESDVKVTEKKEKIEWNSHSHAQTESKIIFKIITSAVLFLVGICIFYLTNVKWCFTFLIFLASYLVVGLDVVINAVKNILKGQVFDENFLMSVSSIGAFLLGEYPEAAAVMLFYQIGEFFQDRAVAKSRKSIKELMNIKPDFAVKKVGSKFLKVEPESVAVGDVIVVKPGEKIPLDGIVLSGNSSLDTAALTGESVPRTVAEGDSVYSGSINQKGALEISVSKPYHQSTVAKILNLVENASSKKAKSENFITAFSRYYTPLVVIGAVLLSVLPPLIFGGEFSQWIRRSLVFLVISCPCALVISVPLTFFGGIGAASKNGVLIKGGNYLEALNKVKTVVFDKTGTLTEGVFTVTDIKTANGFSREDVLKYTAAAEQFSNHPIAKSIIISTADFGDDFKVENFTEKAGLGITATVNGKGVAVGNEKLMESLNINLQKSVAAGTNIYVSIDSCFAGSITISDKIKNDSKKGIEALKKCGIKRTVMLTGDSEQIAKSVANELSIDEYVSELMPDGKVEKMEKILSGVPKNEKVAFVGDGINDAPVLMRADVGISMGALGSDAAIEAADIVLMTDEVSKLSAAFKVASKTRKIVVQNIVFALFVKFVFLILGAFGVAGMWEAVFGDVGVMIIAVLNSMRILKNK